LAFSVVAKTAAGIIWKWLTQEKHKYPVPVLGAKIGKINQTNQSQSNNNKK
jgi:hypothetical protein